MMTREHHGNHRRRSPESERRRRKERRNSREQVLNQLQHIPEADQYQIAVRQQPSHNDSYETQLYARPSSSYAQPHPPPQSQSQYSRSRALSSSGESSSSSTSSSLVNISRHGRGFGFKSFFTAAAEKHKRRVRKQRSRRMFRFGNGSSSSDLSDLAYGKGYIDRRRSRDFTPPGSQKRRDSGERPGPPKRAQTDEEIIELGRKFAEIARQQNKEDLRRAGRHKPSALLGAATALSAYNKTSSGGPADRGIGSSKHSRRHSSDDSEWESASEDESSSEDDGLMYGSATHLPSDGQHPIHISSPPPVHGQGEYERMLQHKPSIVDPNLFGPVNSLRGHVNTPCGFDKLDRGTVINGYQVTEAARPSASIPQNETVSYEDRPLQHVYPIPTSDPNVYKTGRGSMVSIEQDSPRGRPAPVPIQQPKPIAPVSSKVFEATDADARYSRRSSSSGTALAGAAAVGLAGAAIANVVANHKDKDDRREGLDKYHQERRERDIEKGRERERDEKRRSKRSDDKYAESSYTESRHGDERDEKRKSRRSGDKHTDSRYAESQIGDDRDQKRRSRHSDDKHDEREEKRKSRDGDRDYERSEKRREKEKLKELEASGSKRAEDADRENVRDKPVRKDRDDDHDYSREYRGHERREDRKKDKERRKEERRQEKSLAGRSSDIDVYRRLEDPEDPLYEGPIDPFQFQVPNDAFATPQRPLTPNVFTVDREPDFSKFDDDFKPPERMSRRDSYERELMDTEAIYDSTRNATVPIAAGAIAAATAAIGMEERRGRSRSRGGDETSRVRQDNHDVVQDVANILYRRDLLARQAAEERSRSTSPDHSVLDKWKEEPETTAPEIITPPAKDAPKPKSPYDGPDADVRIDNILTPRDLPLRANGRSFISRDPSAERDRPVLNLVRPTPAPTPQPEKQKAREDTREEIPREKESKREFKKKKRNPPLIEHIKSVDDVVISPRGEVVSTPSTPTSKGVTWGMNETRRYVVESPERGHDEHSGSRVVTPAETPKSKSGKKSGWGILASAIAGTGAAAAASVISDSGKDKDKDETSSNVSSTSRRSRDRDSPREKGLERDEVGSNVSSNSRKSKDRDFPKDRDREEISSNVSSSSKKSRDRDSPEFKDMDRDDIFSNISSSSKRSRDRDLPKDRDEIASNVSSSSRKSRDRDTPRDRDEVSSNISSLSRKSRDSPKGKRQSSVPWDEIEEPPIPGPKPSSPRGAPMPGTFAEDMAFTATIAAGLQDSGFDPNIVIDDAKYHRRDSPPNTNGKPNLYSAPFAETVTDLGIYPAEATGSKTGSDHGFVIGEIPETPQDQRDIPSDTVDLSKLSKKERKKLERENSAKRDNLENLDDLRSQIVVEEEPAAPQSVPERLVEDDDWTSTATLSKKEQKKRDKAARAKALQEEESGVSTPRDSEPETPQPTMEEDEWGSSSKLSKKEKKKLEKAGKNKALEEEEIVEIPTPQEPEHHPIGAKIVDEWEDSSSKKKSKKDKKKEKAVIVQDDAKDLGDMESSKISVPVDTFRDIQEEKRFAQPEDDWSGPSKKSKKKGKRDSASYDFTSEPATPVGGEDVGYIQEEAQIAQPDDDWALPGSSKKSKKKSKQDSEHYDSSSQSFTPHETDTPSGLVQEEAPFPQPEDDWTSSTTKKSKKKSKRDSEIYDSPSQSVLPSESESPRDLQEETTIARPEDDWAAPATKKSKKKSKRNSEILDSPSQTATPTEIDVPRDIQESSFVQPEDDWSAPSKKSKKKSKRDSEVYDSPSQSTAQFEKGESPKNDGEDEITVVPDDEWDVSKKSTKKHSKQDSFATDTTDWTNVPSVASESMIKSQSTDYFSTAEPASVDDWELPSKKSKKKSKRESTSYDSPSQTPTGRDDIVESPKAMTESFSDLRSEKSGAQNDEWDEPKKSKKKSKRDSHIHDSPSGSRSASLSRTQSEISTSDKKKSKRNSYHESLPGSEIGSESSERKSKKEKRRSLPGGFPDDFDDRDPPDRGRKDFPFLDNDVSSVVSAPLRDRSEKRSRSRFDDLDDDAKSIASAPGGSRKKDSKSEKDKEKRNSAGPGLFDRFKSSIGIVDASDKSSRKEEDKKALKDNAGTLGASVGLLGAAAALITSQMSPSNATDVPSEGKEAHSIPTTPSRRLSPSPPPRRSSDSIDPEIVQREIRPAIDPQYGDLLPLPPSPPPGLPTTHETDDLPALPDSRPETPETERQLLRELHNKPSHIRRKSANETPTRLKSPSQSAIPLRFGVGKVKRPSEPPSLPGFHRSSPISSPIAAPTDTLSATKPRPARPTSWDSTREFKPLYLVEKTSRESVTAPPEIEGDLPQLPESGPPSRESPGPEFGRREHDVQYEHAQNLSNDLALKLDIPAALAVSDDTHLGSQDTTPKAQTSGLSDAFGTPRQTEEKPDSSNLPSLPGTETHSTPKPEPVESMSKDRSSYLLHSSPPSAVKNLQSDDIAQDSPTRSLSRSGVLSDISEGGDEAASKEPVDLGLVTGIAAGAAAAITLLDEDRSIPAKDIQNDEEPSEFAYTPSKKSKKSKKAKKSTAAEVEESPISTPPIPTSQIIEESSTSKDITEDDSAFIHTSKKGKKSKKNKKALDWEPEREPEVQDTTILTNDQLSTSDNQVLPPPDEIPGAIQEIEQQQPKSDTEAPLLQRSTSSSKKDKKKKGKSLAWDPEPEPESVYATPMEPVLGKSTDFVFPQSTLKELDTAQEVVQRNLSEPTQQSRIEESQPTVAEEPVSTTKNSKKKKKKGKASQLQSQSWEPEPDSGFIQDVEIANSVNTSSEATQIAPAMEIETVLPFEEQFSTPTEELQHTPMVDLPLRADLSPALETRQPDALQSTSAGDQLTTNTSGLESASVEMPSLGRTSPAPEPDLPAPIPADLQAENHTDTMDFSDGRVVESPLPGNVAEAPLQPNPGSGESQWHLEPGLSGSLEDPLPTNDSGDNTIDRPAQPPASLGENIDSNAISVGSNLSSGQGFSEPFGSWQEDSSSKKKKSKKDKKQQSISRELEPGTPSDASEIISDPLSRSVDLSEQPVEASPLSNELPSSSQPEMEATADDIWSTSAKSGKKGKKGKKNRQSSGPNDLGDTAQQPAGEIPFVSHEGRDTQLEPGGGSQLPASTSWAGEVEGSDPVISEPQPEPEATISKKKSKKDKKKNRASSQFDDDLGEVPPQKLQEPTLSQEMPVDAATIAEPAPILSEDRAFEQPELENGLVDELSPAASQKSEQKKKDQSIQWEDPPFASDAPQESHDVSPSGGETPQAEDNWDSGFTSSKKSKKDKKKRKVIFAGTSDEQLRDNALTEESAQTSGGIQPQPGPALESGSDVPGEDLPTAETTQLGIVPDALSGDTVHHQSEPAPGNSGGDLNVIHSSSETRDLPESDVPQQSGHVQELPSEPASEQLLEGTSSLTTEDPGTQLASQELPATSAEEEFPIMTTKKSKKDKKKRKGKTDDLLESTSGTSTPQDDIALGTSTPEPVISATIQDQAPLEQAISASQIMEEPQEVKLEDQTMDDEWGSLPAKKSKKDKKKNKKGSQIQELEPEKLPMEESQVERRPSSSPTTTLPDPVLDPLEKSMLAPLGHSQLSRPQSPILPQDSSEPIVSGQQDLSEEPIQSPAADPVANLLPQFSELETGLLPSTSQGADEIVSESQKPHSDEPTLERPQLLAHTTDYFDSVASQVVSEGASTPAEQSLEAGEDEFAPITSKKDKKKKKRRSLAQEPELARKSSFEEMMGDWQADEPLPTPGQDFYTPLEQPTETQQDQPAENSTKTSKKDRKKKRASRTPSDECSTPPSDQALAERPASPSQVLNSDSNPTESQTLALVDEPAPIQEQDEALPTILEQSIELPQPSQVPDEQLVSNPELMADIQNITGEPLSRTEMPAAIQVDETPAMDSLPTPLGHDGNDEVRQKDSIAIAHEQQQSPLPDVQPAEVESTQSFTTPKSKKDKKKKKRGSQILADEAVLAPEDDLPALIPVSQDQDLGVQSQMPEASSQPIESQPVEFQHEEIPISTPLVEESSQFSAEPGIPTTKKSKKDKKKKKQTASWEDDLPRDQIETPVDQIGASVGQIETPVDQIETTTDQIETPVDQIETPVDQIETTTDQIETPVDQIETPVDQIGTATKQIETPVDQIETTVKQSEISGESVPTEQLQTDSPIHLGQSEPEVSVPAGSSKDDDFGGFTSSKKSKKDKKKKKQASSWENDLPVDQIETPIESVSAEQAQPDLPVTMGQIEMPIEAVPAEQLHTDLPTTLGQAEAETPVPAQSSKDDEFAEFTSSKKSKKDKKKKKGVSSSEFDGQQQQETPSDGSRDLGSLDVESSQIPADVQLPVSQDDEFPSFTSSKKSKKDKKKKLASTWEPEAGSEAEIVTPTEEVREPPDEPSLPTGQDLAIQNEPSMSEDLSQPSQQASDEQRLDHLPTQLDTIPSTQSKFEGSFPTDIANEPKQDQIDIQEPTTSTSAEISQELEQNQPSKQQDTELGTGEPALSEEQQPLGQSSPIIPPATEAPVLEPDIDLPQSTEQSPQEEEPGSGSFVTKKSKKDKKKKRASQIQDLEPELSSTPVVERSPVLETPVVVETPIIAAPLPDAEVSVESELPGDSGLSTSQTAQSEDVFPELVTGKKSKKDKKKKKKGSQAQDWEPEVEPAFATPLEEPARQLEEQLPPPTTADLSLPIEQLEIENVQLPLEQTSTPSEVPRENDAPALEETQPEDVLPQVVSGKKSKKDKKKKRASQLQDWEPESSLSSPIQDQPVSLPTELDTGSGEPAAQEGVSDFKELEASQDTNSGSLHDVGSGQDQKEEKDQDTLSLETPGIDSFYTPFEETHGSLTTFNDASLPKQHVEMSGNSNDDLTISKDLELDDDFTAPTPSKQTKKDKKKKKGQQPQFDREDPDISIMPVETQPVQELPSETPLVEEFLGGGNEVILDDSALPRDLQPEEDVPEFVSTKKSKKDKKKGKKAAALQTEPELDSSSRDLPGESSLPHTESPSDQIPSAVNENLDVATEHENLRSDPLENLEVSSHQPSSQLESLTQPEDSTTPVAKDVDEVPDGGHGSLALTDNYDRSQDPAIVHAEDLSKDSTFGTVPDATTTVSQDDSTEFPDFAVKKSKKDKKKGKKSKASESLPWQDNMETSGGPTPIEEPVLSQEVQQDVLTGSTPTTQLGALDEAIPQDIPLEQPSTLPIHADDTPIGNVGTPQSQLLADDPVVQPTEPMISTPDVVEEDLFPIGRKKSKKDKKKQKALALVDSEPTSGTQTPPTQDEQTPGLPLPEALPLESQGSTSTREVVEEVPSQDPMELDIGGKTVTEQPDPSQVVIEDWPDFSAKKSKKDKKKRKSTAQSLDFETPSGVQTPSIEDAPLDREIGGDIATVEESKPLFTEQPISGEPLQATPAEPVEQEEWPQNTSKKSKKDKKKRKSSGLLESEPTSGTQTPLATDVALGEDLGEDLSRNIPALEQPASEVMELPPVEEVPESSAAPVGDDEWANFTSSKKSKKDKKGKKKGKSSGTATPLETTQPVIIPTQDDRQESVAENPEPSAVKDVWADDAFFKPQETTPGMTPKLESSQAENIPLDRPGTSPGLSTSTIPPAVDVDLSPAQLTSHVDHDKPFDQTTQRGKKVRMNTFLGDTEIPEPISATEPISADRDLAALYLEDSSQTPNEPTVPEVVMEDSSAHLPERTLSPPTARDIAVDYLNPQHDQGGASGSADVTTNLNKDLDASLPNVNADREFAVSYLESQTKNMEDIISQTEHEQLLRVGKSGPPAITPRREIAASYFDPEPGVLEGKQKGVIAAEYPPKLDEPSLNIKDGGQTQQDATHDLAADLMEPPPSTSKKSSKSTTSKEESEKDDKSKDAEAIAAAAALTGGVAMLADKFGGSKKGKGKKGKKSKYVDKRQPKEDDLFDDPSLWESSDRKIVTENDGGRLDRDVGDFWDVPADAEEDQSGPSFSQEMGEKDSEGQARGAVHEIIAGSSASPESPVVGRVEMKSSATKSESLSKDRLEQLESRTQEEASNSRLMRDIDELDTSESVPERGFEETPGLDVRQQIPSPSRDMADWGRSSIMSARSLPPVEEEPNEDLEEELHRSRSRSRSRSRHVAHDPEVNRDSGFVTDSPRPTRRSLFEDSRQRDSGVHMKDWPESTGKKREGLSLFDETGARLSWESTDSKTGIPREVHTPKAEEKKLRKSTLGDETPRLDTPSRTHRETSPDPEKKGKSHAVETKTPRPAKYQNLGAGASPALTPHAFGQRSASDNMSRDGTPRDEHSARRSASNTSISRLRTPEPLNLRPGSPGSIRSSGTNTPPLRRVDKRMSGDLRSLSQHNASVSSLHSSLSAKPSDKDAAAALQREKDQAERRASQTFSTPVANEGRVRQRDMTDVYDGVGEGRIGSPRSPTRPHSMRRRQSMQVLELESRVEQLVAENRMLADARLQADANGNQRAAITINERDALIEQLRSSLEEYKREVERLKEVNEGLHSANAQLATQQNERYSHLQLQHASASSELEGMRSSLNKSLQDKDAEIEQLRNELEATRQQVRAMQQQILASKPADADFLRLKDEDHFDHRCQQLCAHVQQWVLRFSKFSDMRASRLTSEINDVKIVDKLDNTVLDGSDVDDYLSDRVKRRDIFMSMTMHMIWEYVFTRYLFGMDREQRQKLKTLEKLLSDVGPPHAVRQWRAVTLTLLSRRPVFGDQRNDDTEAVVQAILETLSKILPPPSNMENQIQSQLRRVLREAVDLSIEMRTQRAEYMMLPPLQPEYDANGDLAETVAFNAALMNERSGGSTSNEELEAQGAVVRMVLFPLVIKKGDDNGVGDDEIVVCPAQVLVAKQSHRSMRMVTPSSEFGGAPLSRGATPSVGMKSAISLPMSPGSQAGDYNMEGAI